MYASITPSVGAPGATDGATVEALSAVRITMGRAGRREQLELGGGDLAELLRPAATDATINANGRSSRCLRERNRATAASEHASTARW